MQPGYRDLLEPLLRRSHREPRDPGSYDPVRVEAEFYDAIYGRRTGTVENIAPLDPARKRSSRRVAPAAKALKRSA